MKKITYEQPSAAVLEIKTKTQMMALSADPVGSTEEYSLEETDWE